MKRKPLKRVSDKLRVLNALCKPTRDQFRQEFPVCMSCETHPAADVHEITSGAAREHVLGEPRLLLSVCRECHERLDNTAVWTVAKQIAIRIHAEIARTVWVANDVRGRAQTGVTAEEVLEVMK